ncbi:MAG TPA: hypothetical protein VKR28_06065 [Candidatus Binatus sp.]|nr:hypothetical protein [Candidatus Binatus sp.]
MVALIYYSFLIGYVAIGVVAVGIKTAAQHHAAASDVANTHPAKFDVDEDCKVVYISSPIDYEENTADRIEAKSGKNCVIRIFAYTLKNETEASQLHPNTLDTTHSVPGVLELPTNSSD